MSAQVAILAGGQSRRMGTDKSFVLLNGKPLLQHVIERVSELKLPVTLIANETDKYRGFGLPVVSDVIANAGSLGGVYTAVQQGDADRTLCVACDMPFINPTLLNYLLALSSKADAVVPMVAGTAHALHAVYRQTCLSAMRAQIMRGDLAIHRLFSQVDAHFIDEDMLRLLDPDLQSLVNVNTPQELAVYQEANSVKSP
jgi:molybdopterin-guanine dinucleotide biosynthesis protein A